MSAGTYRSTSEQSGLRSESIAKTFLIEKGYIPLPAPRDCVFDFALCKGLDPETGKWCFETVQVKTLQGNKLTKIVDRSGDVVSRNGKERNSLDYSEYGVDWLLGVGRDGQVHAYSLKVYRGIPTKSFSVRKYPSVEFPECNSNTSSDNEIKMKKTLDK